MILLRPIEYVRDVNGNLLGLRCLRTKLQADTSAGRHLPMDIPGSEFILSAGCVIEAIGQKADEMAQRCLAGLPWTDGGTLAVDPQTHQTNVPGVFAGGDLVNGGQTAAQAIAEALQAAEHMNRYVQRHKSR